MLTQEHKISWSRHFKQDCNGVVALFQLLV